MTTQRITAVPFFPGVPPEEIPLVDLIRVQARMQRILARLAIDHIRCALAELDMACVLLGSELEAGS